MPDKPKNPAKVAVEKLHPLNDSRPFSHIVALRAADENTITEAYADFMETVNSLLLELSPGMMEEMREVWGNTNVNIIQGKIKELRDILGVIEDE